MNALPFRLDRSIVIGARRETVFGFFTDDARWARWWGAGSTIDACVGGRVYIRYPGNVEVSGEVLEIAPPDRIVFSYGYETGTPFGPGESRVTITLEAQGKGTRLRLAHEFAEAAPCVEHVQGWRFQLSLFANVIADEVHVGAADATDDWFRAWAEPDPDARRALLLRIAEPDISFRDRYSMIDGVDELSLHIGAAQRFMPGIRMERRGAIRHTQGTVLADWVALTKDGQAAMQGINVFLFGANGKIESATGLVSPPQTP